MKKAFTLIEVNLAMLIMAGGILSIVGLYSFAFRENRQSREDVASAALADAVVSPLVMAISATNLKWSAFKNIGSFPSDRGWKDYYGSNGNTTSDPESKAKSVFDSALGAYLGAADGTAPEIAKEFPNSQAAGVSCGLVVMHKTGSPVVGIGFRATRKANQLMSMPLYYTEVRFQGLGDK